MSETRPGLILSERLDEAVTYARTIHSQQTRKGTAIPFSHLLSVAALVVEDGVEDEDLVIGALLHDAAEDQGGPKRLRGARTRTGTLERCATPMV